MYLLRRLLAGKSRAGWSERWGAAPVRSERGRARVWVHAASVGEVVAATPIMTALRTAHPEWEIIVSVITPGGHEVAAQLAPTTVDRVFYAPFDLWWVARRAVGRARPDLFVCMETELWPNLVHLLRSAGARLALLNARLSDRSFPRYRRLRWLFGPTLRQFDCILAQSDRDALRFREVGAVADRVRAAGNAKYDQQIDVPGPAELELMRASFGLSDGAPVLVVGSTRVPEEERLVLAAYGIACRALPDLALILAPRHVDRADEVEALMREAGLAPVRRSALRESPRPSSQIILDTFGELARVYALADVAFVGNSLVAPGGGQSPMQPMAQGKAVLFGRWMQNFRDAAELAEAAGAGFRVDGADDMAAQIVALVGDRGQRERIAVASLALVERSKGAAARCAQAAAELLRG